MTHFPKILLDSDFIINTLIQNESNHERARDILSKYPEASFYMLNLVHYEVATVLSRKIPYADMAQAMAALRSTEPQTIMLQPDQENLAWQEFYSHKKKGISFVDCANVVMAKTYNMRIASFDKFYPDELILR